MFEENEAMIARKGRHLYVLMMVDSVVVVVVVFIYVIELFALYVIALLAIQ